MVLENQYLNNSGGKRTHGSQDEKNKIDYFISQNQTNKPCYVMHFDEKMPYMIHMLKH